MGWLKRACFNLFTTFLDININRKHDEVSVRPLNIDLSLGGFLWPAGHLYNRARRERNGIRAIAVDIGSIRKDGVFQSE
jgi:hypothetical protein